MAGSKNQVTLTFAGDHDKLTQSFEEVGSAAKEMDGEVGKASKSFDTVGEGFDTAEQRAMGFRDTMTGVQDTASGVGDIMRGNVFEGTLTLGAGIGDLASGFSNALIPALSSSVTWLGNTRVGMLAQAAASKVVKAATLVWTGVQWALNAALTANPIGLVVVAIGLLVAGIVIAYKRSETFRNIVQGAFRAVGKAVSWLGDRFQDWWRGTKRVIGFVTGAFGDIPGRLRRAFGRVFGIITAPFRSAFNFVASAWNNTVGRLSWSIPSWVPGIGGNSISAPRLPQFHAGGIVPGTAGQEMLAVLRAGERVTAPAGGGQSMRLSVERGDGGTSVEQAVADLLLRLVRTGALALRVRQGQVVV